MAYSQADYDAIDAAIKGGALKVEYPNGGSVVYRSLAEMRAIRSDIARALAVSSGAVPTRRVKIFATKDL